MGGSRVLQRQRGNQSQRRGAREHRARRIVAAAGVAALIGSGGVFVTASGAMAAAPEEVVTYQYLGENAQTFTVPSGVDEIDFVVTGASGGKGGGTNGGLGGIAHEVTGSLEVTAGQVLDVYVAAPGGNGLTEDDTENSEPTVGLPGDGGWGYTSGGDGGFGSLISRPGGGGGGSSAIVVQGADAPAALGAGGGGGGGRGIFGFCFGGDGGDGDVNGGAGLAADDCLIPGLGGLTDLGLDGNGTDGGDVILYGGGGGGGGAGALGQGGGGGFAGAHPGVPVNLGAGGGGGAGGGSVLTDLEGSIGPADPETAPRVQISYVQSYDTALTASPVGTPVYGADATVEVTVANTTDPSVTVDGGTVTVSHDGVDASADVQNGVATVVLPDLPPGTTALDLAYAPVVDAPFEASTGTGSITVAAAPTTTTLTVEGTPVFGDVALTATVQSTEAGAGLPTGTVELRTDGGLVATATLNDGIAAFAFDEDLVPGRYDLTAVYTGDDDFAGSDSDEVALQVAKGITAVSVATSPNPNPSSAAVHPVVTLSGSSALVGPSGTISLRVDGAVVESIEVLEEGRQTLSVAFGAVTLSPGTHTIDAVYEGNLLFRSAVSAPITQTTTAVGPPPAPASLPTTGGDPVGGAILAGLLLAAGLGAGALRLAFRRTQHRAGR